MEENFENQVQGNVQPNYDMGVDFAPQPDTVVSQQVQATYVGNEVSSVPNPTDYVSQEPTYTQEAQVQPAQVQPAQVQEAQVQEAQVQVAQEAPVPPTQQAVELKSPVDLKPEDVRIVVKTDVLKEAIKKADIVAGKDEMQPFTEVIMFRVMENGIMQVRSTDRDNILTVNVKVLEATSNTVMTLRADQIKPLLDKLTKTEVMAFVIEDTIVTIYTGEGTYKMQQAIDLTTNNVIQLPEIDDGIPFENTIAIEKDRFLPYLEATLPLVEKMASDNSYAGIHFGEYVSSTNGDDASIVADNLQTVFGRTMFIKTSTAKKLVSMGASDKINIGFGEISGRDTLCFYVDDYKLFSVAKDGEDEYPLESINELLSLSKGSMFSIKREQLAGALERLSIFFVSGLTRQVIDMEVANGKITISNELKAVETYPSNSTQNVKFKIEKTEILNILKGIKSENIYIEPVIDGDGPISYIRISDGGKILSVKGTAL